MNSEYCLERTIEETYKSLQLRTIWFFQINYVPSKGDRMLLVTCLHCSLERYTSILNKAARFEKFANRTPTTDGVDCGHQQNKYTVHLLVTVAGFKFLGQMELVDYP